MSHNNKNDEKQNALVEKIVAQRTVEIEKYLRFEQGLIDAIPFPVFFKDLDGYYMGSNKAFADFVGIYRESMSDGKLYGFLVPEYAEQYRQIDKEVVASGEGKSFEGQAKGADGTMHPVVYDKAVIYDENSEITGLVTTFFDLSDLKHTEAALSESEAQREAILHGFPGLLTLLDIDLTIIWANDSALGFSHNCVGRKCFEAFAGRKLSCPGCAVAKSLASGKVETCLQDMAYSSEQMSRLYEVVGTPVKNSQGEVVNVISIARDVTERQKLEKQLRSAQKLEAIGTLAGGIAHDFNNVLTPIMGYSEMLRLKFRQHGEDDQEADNYLGEILKAARRAKSLVDQILTFSRSQEHEEKPQPIHPIIKEVLKLLRVSMPSTIEFKQNIDEQCGLVRVDPVQLHQVVINLCTNSGHAMEGRQGVLSISLQKDEQRNNDGKKWLCLSIGDTGEGIESAVLDRIFDPYFTTKEKSRGTGMGLAMVHGIVTGQGGEIKVESEPGVGTKFNIFFPIVKEDVTVGDPMLAGAVLPEGSEKILLVDDEQQVVQVTAALLGNLGYDVTGFTSSTEAMQAFVNGADAFDLVITDMTMPKLTGLELSKELQKIKKDVKIILCTGNSEMIPQEDIDDACVAEYLLKPVPLQKLAETVRRVIDQ